MRRKYKSIALKKELANDSGKKKCHAMKAQAIVTSQGRIVSLDITVNYCHDMKLFKMSCRNIGQAGKILADSGYQGLMKIYPQAQTPRKSSKLKPFELTSSVLSTTSKLCFEQPTASFLVCSLIFIEYYSKQFF
ncbi:transposase-like protein%2C IS1381 ISSpn7 [Streptococcus pneumoniae]|nr:transposase-like protein%2C IS1381 ISSpn7 [Streptococcus pneumoniae]